MNQTFFNILYTTVTDIKRKTVYYVVEDDRSKVMDAFHNLHTNQKNALKDIIKNIATLGSKYKNPNIKPLKGFKNLYQIREGQNRFYYFTIIDEHIILFDHLIKKSKQLPHEIYISINKKREKYESEFRRQKQI